MADYVAPAANKEPTGSAAWGVGFLFFAAPIIVMVGLFQMIQGLGAILNGAFYTTPPNYAYALDPTTWGWIHFLLGILVVATAIFLALGKPWARATAIVISVVSAVTNFFTIPDYPVWSLMIIGLDVVIIWAVLAGGKDLQEMMS